MNKHPYTLPRGPGLIWAGPLGIAWRLLLPVLALAVLLEAGPWLKPLPRLVPGSEAAAPAAVPRAFAEGIAVGMGMAFEAVVFSLGCLLIFGGLVVVQAFGSPLPSYRRYLHARPWALLLGALAVLLWVSHFRGHASWLTTDWTTRYYLSCGLLALGLPSLVEWLTAPRRH